MDILIIPLCALANRLAGWDRWPLGKAGAMVLPAFVPVISNWGEFAPLSESALNALIHAGMVFLGLLFWRVWGTDNTFTAIHGVAPGRLSWDGRIAWGIVPRANSKLFGVVAGFFRGSIASIPLAAGLSWLSGAWLTLAWFPLLAGIAWAFCYWLSGAFGERKSSVPVAEILTGACMGGLAWIAIQDASWTL